MMHKFCRASIPMLALVAIMSFVSEGKSFGADGTSVKSETRTVARGDLVTCSVSLSLPDGALVYTTDEEAAKSPKTPKAAYYRTPECFQPLTVVAGKSSSVPGLEECLPGMNEGETRRFVLPPQKGFGAAGEVGRQTFPRIRMEKRRVILTPREYVDMIGTIPKPGDAVQLNPYFTSRVAAMDSHGVEIENTAVDGARIEGPFGVTVLKVNGDLIEVILEPVIGSTIDLEGRKGVIASSDEKTFTVDFNHPLAGMPLNLDIRVLKVIPSETAAVKRIDWTDDYGKASGFSHMNGKPLVLVLHASWCQFCRSYITGTLEDESIRDLSERFIWARVESGGNKDMMEKFGQKSFPLTIILDPEGRELYRINGAVDAFRLRSVLDCILSGRTMSKRPETGDGDETGSAGCESGCTDKAGS